VGSLDTTGDYNVSKFLLFNLSHKTDSEGNSILQYYISQAVNTNDLKGISAFVLASVEYEHAVADHQVASA
jgi:hypothetical protein